MKVYKQPAKNEWKSICVRPSFDKKELENVVSEILKNVQLNGDKALAEYSLKFDGAQQTELEVSDAEIQLANESLNPELKEAIQLAFRNIQCFHENQRESIQKIETTEGVECWRQSVGIEKVGLYIPGGSAPLFSTILMLGIPAKLAGCKEIIMCTPASKNGRVNPAILYTAMLVGVTKVYKIGGAQAIAAMAYGTETLPAVSKIFGPGNQYVTKAKELIQLDGIAIDMPAGPSEVLVIADETCNPTFVAADLLSQAEHGADSQVVLLSDSEKVISKTIDELKLQLDLLPRKEVAEKALKNSVAVVCNSLEKCIQLSNDYAPEHLIIASENADHFIRAIVNAGSVFLGNYSCESAGDYASGTNHTLPTNGSAKNYSGVSLDSFVRKITFQKLNRKGIQNIGPAIELMAEAEELFAHKNAVSIRLKSLNNV